MRFNEIKEDRKIQNTSQPDHDEGLTAKAEVDAVVVSEREDTTSLKSKKEVYA